jgi:glycolate oxidase
VFPGTLAASLGGNVATNAGGMRAVKYGVTRNQVLGLEAVIGTGEVIRSGGRFVKNTSGYDLTQLIIGSEGTLALVTEATLKLHPRLTHTASILAPFATVDDVATVVPRIVASGVQPMILEYIDRATMTGLVRANDLTLGVPTEVVERTEAYLIVVLEGRDEARLDTDVAIVADQLADAGAHDVYVLPSGQGAELLAARENAFWMIKAAGADDVIDMVVPRSRIPEYLRNVQLLARAHRSKVFGCGHAGDGNIHFSVYEPDATRRSRLMRAIFTMGHDMGGAVSGEHGIGRTKRDYYADLEDPGKLALQRRIKAAFDPSGILNPGCIFPTA